MSIAYRDDATTPHRAPAAVAMANEERERLRRIVSWFNDRAEREIATRYRGSWARANARLGRDARGRAL